MKISLVLSTVVALTLLTTTTALASHGATAVAAPVPAHGSIWVGAGLDRYHSSHILPAIPARELTDAILHHNDWVVSTGAHIMPAMPAQALTDAILHHNDWVVSNGAHIVPAMPAQALTDAILHHNDWVVSNGAHIVPAMLVGELTDAILYRGILGH